MAVKLGSFKFKYASQFPLFMNVSIFVTAVYSTLVGEWSIVIGLSVCL